MSKGLPISLLMTMAMAAHDDEAVQRLVCQAFEDITHELMAVVTSHDGSDLPFVVATMLIAANSLRTIMNESGNALVDNLVSHTKTITVDLNGLLDQMGASDGGEE